LELERLDEENRGLLKRIVEGQAYRQLMLCNIRGHGLKFVPDLEHKIQMTEALDTSLRQFREVQRLYSQLGHADVISAVRGKMERVPFAESRMELAVCLFLCERVQHLALETYVDSSCKEFAAIARTRFEANRLLESPDDPAFAEFCADETHRPHAQQLVNRWLGITLLALGRPGSSRDRRVAELGLRSRTMAEVARDFLGGLHPFLERCGLVRPDAVTLGVELPEAFVNPEQR
jgi:1,2-phenylacetyl-CoA epoxidase catalytic subunit